MCHATMKQGNEERFGAKQLNPASRLAQWLHKCVLAALLTTHIHQALEVGYRRAPSVLTARQTAFAFAFA